MAVSSEFVTFTNRIGLRKEHAEALWQADIRTPQELGSLEVDQLKGICNNPMLLNSIHPLLKKYVFNITTAPDPFKKALHIIQKNAPKDDEDMEITDTAADSAHSDAVGYREGANPPPNGVVAEPGEPTRVVAEPTSTTYGNTGSRVTANGNRVLQTNVGDEKKHKKFGINISGGNFVQANIMGTGPVTYNNTNTVISTSLGSGSDAGMDLKKLREQKLNESLVLNGNLVQMRDVGWMTGDEFWIGNDLKVTASTREQYSRFYGSKDVYQVRNFGQNRALIINNYEFEPHTRMNKRNGADRDTNNMEMALSQLGFRVTCHRNRKKNEILQLLREFAKSEENIAADMVAVYIGSHGERDDQGRDTFVGVDGERVRFEEVKEIFSPASCRYLVDKPKIFFLQFCRQGTSPSPPAALAHPSSDGRTRHDAGTFEEQDESDDQRLMDFLCVYATLAGNKAYRDTMDGSWFVSCLVRVLAENANKEDLQSMLTQVNNSVSAMAGQEGRKRALQISEVVHNLRKKIYFWPGV